MCEKCEPLWGCSLFAQFSLICCLSKNSYSPSIVHVWFPVPQFVLLLPFCLIASLLPLLPLLTPTLLESPDVFLIMFMIWPYGCTLCLCVFVFVCAVKDRQCIRGSYTLQSLNYTIREPFLSRRSQTLCWFCCGLFVCLLVHVHNKKKHAYNSYVLCGHHLPM